MAQVKAREVVASEEPDGEGDDPDHRDQKHKNPTEEPVRADLGAELGLQEDVLICLGQF